MSSAFWSGAMGYHGRMPSWNIHTVHVERLLADNGAAACIADGNAFLFGNYVPDIYLGFMVSDTTYRIDYCLTHLADVHAIPIPDADWFWDQNVYRRFPSSAVGKSLVLGAWAHLFTDRIYNMRFRALVEERGLEVNDDLRIYKQSDFDLFGRSLDYSSLVRVTDELLEAAQRFRPYSILPVDVEKAVDVANAIVSRSAPVRGAQDYQLLDTAWMSETFDECARGLASWLRIWGEHGEERLSSEDMRALLP